MKLSVVVAVKNEEKRIKECLESIILNNPDEIIVVVGDSNDKTAQIARQYTDKVIETVNSSLSRDRQTGIDNAKNDYIAMIDADHRLEKGDLQKLYDDLIENNYDIIQSSLKSYKNNNWMNRAEEQMWELNHNIPGERKMIGTAPDIYKKELFNKIKFDNNITKTIDDTDFMYRLSLIDNIKLGVSKVKIAQLHESTTKSYLTKFRWYGVGDGEFCIKHKCRTFSMLFHLFIRYPFIYNIKALLKGKYYAIPYQALQGWVRGYYCIKTLFSSK